MINRYPFMRGHALENHDCESVFDPGLQWYSNSLEAWIEGLHTNMSTDLFDEMIIPMPAQAGNQIITGYLRKRSQAAKTN
jgi:hypothetical protein